MIVFQLVIKKDQQQGDRRNALLAINNELLAILVADDD